MNRIAFITFLTLGFVLTACDEDPVSSNEIDNDGRIMFIRNSREFSQICTIKPDGTDMRVIANYDYNGEFRYEGYIYCRWSPDKSRIVVEGGPRNVRGFVGWNPLWMMDMNGRLLYKLIWSGSRPVWSPDGRKIAYVRNRSYVQDLYEIEASGGNETILLEAEIGSGWGYSYFPYDWFSGQKSEILLSETFIFTDSTGKRGVRPSELLAYDPDSKGKRYLTDDKVNNGYGRISPDGTQIMYTSQLPEPYLYYLSDLLLMSSEGDSIRSLTDGRQPVTYFRGAWSPDGQRFVTSEIRSAGFSYEEHGADIYVVDLATSMWDTLTFDRGKGITNLVMDWR
ncbi:MAG: PD40 domain-containing protein [Candidatus Marinimicrobia bacterium]|nr:PD40 domain-containing protein [Candidatus Neomarinimicrobiota bacterium]